MPVPSSKDYIIRPKSNVEEGMSDNKKVNKLILFFLNIFMKILK